MLQLRDISEDTALFPWKKSTPVPAFAPTIAVGLALVLGEATGHRSAGSIAAGSAFTIGFAVFHEALASTLLSMTIATVGIASAALAGSLCAGWTPLVVLICVLAALNYALLSGMSNVGGWVALQCGTFAIISSYFANGVHYALGRAGMVLAGGALQMLVYSLVHLRRRLSQPAKPPLPLQRQVWTRFQQIVRAFRSELHWDRSSTSYAVRLTITLCVSTALYRALHWRNGYWAPMTALLVMKPKWAATLSRGVARLTGTLVGAAICALLALHPPFHHWVYFLMIVITAWACFALQAVNYALFSNFLTIYTVTLFAFGGFSERTAADLRLLTTAVGGVLALLVDFLFQQVGPKLRGVPEQHAVAAGS